MAAENRLDLNEYANKYGVSISTLRRRIRSGGIDYALKDGKYWLVDEEPTQDESASRHRNGSLHEIKQIYGSVLREREDQILRLRDEVSDLKTLVNALESENERLRRSPRA